MSTQPRINNYFSNLLPILVFLSLFSLCLRLGVWQLQRAHEKSLLQKKFTEQQHTEPILLKKNTRITTQQDYFPVSMTGYFDKQHTFFLDNKMYKHHMGYEVLTPFILKDDPHAILVNRGWIPQGQSRKNIPVLKPISGTITITGFILWPKKTFHFKEKTEQTCPQRLQVITPEFLSRQQLKPFLVVINKTGPASFINIGQTVTLLPAKRHYAYAFQWFSLSLALCIAFYTTFTRRANTARVSLRKNKSCQH